MSEPKRRNSTIVFAGIGLELLGIEIAMIFIGYKIDQHFGWEGFALIGLSLLGLVAWLIHVVKMLKHFTDNDADHTQEGS